MLVIAPMLTVIALQAAVLQAAGTGPGLPSTRGPFLALGQPIRALAAGGTRVAALTGRGEVVIFDLEGRVRRRIGASPPIATEGRRRGPPAASGRDGFAIGAGVMDDGDFNDPYDVDSDVEDPENVFLDERAGERRPRRRRPAVAGPTMVAAGGQSVWIAGPGGLARFDDDDLEVGAREQAPRTRSGGGGVWEALAASTDGRWVAGARDGWLVRSSDGGETFAILGPLGDPPGRLAISDEGTVFLIDRQAPNGADVGDRADVVSISSASTIDVVTCGRRAVLLEAERLRVLGAADDEHPIPIIDESPPAETAGVACGGASGLRLVAYGPRLWTLAAGEGSWSRRDELPALPIVSAVVARDSVWVATAAGLWVLPVVAPPEAVVQGVGDKGAAKHLPAPPSLALGATGRWPPESRLAWWAPALPRIDVGFAAAAANDHREVRAFVLLTFIFEGERGWARQRRRLSFEDAAWRRASLGMLVSLSHPPVAGSDPIDQEERAALAHVLESRP